MVSAADWWLVDGLGSWLMIGWWSQQLIDDWLMIWVYDDHGNPAQPHFYSGLYNHIYYNEGNVVHLLQSCDATMAYGNQAIRCMALTPHIHLINNEWSWASSISIHVASEGIYGSKSQSYHISAALELWNVKVTFRHCRAVVAGGFQVSLPTTYFLPLQSKLYSRV